MGWDQAELGMAGESGEMFAACKGAIMAFSRSLGQVAGSGGARELPGPRLDQNRLG